MQTDINKHRITFLSAWATDHACARAALTHVHSVVRSLQNQNIRLKSCMYNVKNNG
ncbi:hypothetical protein J6590_017171 [Homalodisca vitripennis]|nr:hypothetical protein J6590_017171 [Homalodisca vitripennis]